MKRFHHSSSLFVLVMMKGQTQHSSTQPNCGPFGPRRLSRRDQLRRLKGSKVGPYKFNKWVLTPPWWPRGFGAVCCQEESLKLVIVKQSRIFHCFPRFLHLGKKWSRHGYSWHGEGPAIPILIILILLYPSYTFLYILFFLYLVIWHPRIYTSFEEPFQHLSCQGKWKVTDPSWKSSDSPGQQHPVAWL